MDLDKLGRRVSAEIDDYVYEYTSELVGRPLSPERIKADLQEFRSALVAPYWADIIRRDTLEQIRSANPLVCRCAIVAEDGQETVLAFDPAAAEFLLAKNNVNTLESFGVSGDAVGCFMAR